MVLCYFAFPFEILGLKAFVFSLMPLSCMALRCAVFFITDFVIGRMHLAAQIYAWRVNVRYESNYSTNATGRNWSSNVDENRGRLATVGISAK